jgi:hypothetical protein
MDLVGVGYGAVYCDFLELEALVREMRNVLVNLWDKPSIAGIREREGSHWANFSVPFCGTSPESASVGTPPSAISLVDHPKGIMVSLRTSRAFLFII